MKKWFKTIIFTFVAYCLLTGTAYFLMYRQGDVHLPAFTAEFVWIFLALNFALAFITACMLWEKQ